MSHYNRQLCTFNTQVEVTFSLPGAERPKEVAAAKATKRFAIGVCEDPKALGGLTGLNLESGGWASLVKAELQLIMLEAAASP